MTGRFTCITIVLCPISSLLLDHRSLVIFLRAITTQAISLPMAAIPIWLVQKRKIDYLAASQSATIHLQYFTVLPHRTRTDDRLTSSTSWPSILSLVNTPLRGENQSQSIHKAESDPFAGTTIYTFAAQTSRVTGLQYHTTRR